jgi:hypothetical protein
MGVATVGVGWVATIITVAAVAGMEEMFKEIGKPVAAYTFLPTPQITPGELKQFQRIAEKYGQNLYPPDY